MAIDSASSASLAPGFRFHPTDEELVRYYLRRKVCGKPFRFDAISDVDIYKVEPWDLPGRSRLKTRDLEWYFFSVLDKKYGNGSRTNRATDRGYWKTTGKDRPVYHRTQMVGMKKTLVYHSGRAPRGERTNWVMHEYRLIDEELEKAGIVQDSFVLCRIFRKSGSGPKNGEQYGAPFIEEEWEDDELAMVPKEECDEEVTIDNDGLDVNDLEQILGADVPVEDGSLPLNFCFGDGNGDEVSSEFIEDAQEFLADMGGNQPGAEQTDDPRLFDLPVQNGMGATAVKHEYIGETSSNMNSLDVDYLLDQPFLDASDNPSLDDGSFLEANDLKNAVEADPGFDMLEEYLTYFDATADNLPYSFDSSIASEDLVSDSASLAHKYVNDGAQQWTTESKPFVGENSNDVASSSKEPALFGSDIKYPFLKHATRMLGNIPAPPAFASEFPSKEAALHLASASYSPKPVHVTAGMIRIRNMTLSGSGLDMSFGKHGQVNIVLSFSLGDSQIPIDKANSAANSAVSRSWLYCIFFWVLILSMSFKLGSFFCARSFMS